MAMISGRFTIDPSMLKIPSVTINIFSQGFLVLGFPETIFCRISSSKCITSKNINRSIYYN